MKFCHGVPLGAILGPLFMSKCRIPHLWWWHSALKKKNILPMEINEIFITFNFPLGST